MTNSLLAAQAFLFFITGFETASTTMSFALYELALNQQVQDKLHEEIDEEYIKHDGDLIYENIKRMTYLDQVFKGMSSSNYIYYVSFNAQKCISKMYFVKFIYDYFLYIQKPYENTHQ